MRTEDKISAVGSFVDGGGFVVVGGEEVSGGFDDGVVCGEQIDAEPVCALGGEGGTVLVWASLGYSGGVGEGRVRGGLGAIEMWKERGGL